MTHGPERRDTRPRADEEKVFFYRIGQRKYPLRTAQRQFASDLNLVEQIVSSRAAIQQYDNQFDHIGAIRPGCDGIATNPFVKFFVDGQVKRYELSGLEVKRCHLRQLYPESSGLRPLLFDSDNLPRLPGLQHKFKGPPGVNGDPNANLFNFFRMQASAL